MRLAVSADHAVFHALRYATVDRMHADGQDAPTEQFERNDTMARIEKSIEVNVPVHTAYNQLTQFKEFPRFMEGVQEIKQLDDTHLHWHTKSDGHDKEWDSEITQQVPDQCIAWRNVSGPKNTGKIVLQPIAQDKTRVTMNMEVEPERGAANETES